MESCFEPLVTIIVITYNSSKYVLETLESVKAQIYQNIELIVSDDSSTDNTVEICRNWIEENKNRFVNTKLITVENNTGIAPNCNRGLYNAKGDWVKFIAGDDLLYTNCIQLYYEEILRDPQIEILFSNISVNGTIRKSNQELLSFFSLEVDSQYVKLLDGNILSAPASFFRRSTLTKLGGFDERFKLFEDFPFYIKALKAKKRFYFIDKYLVDYRVEGAGISTQERMNKKYYRDVYHFFRKEYISELFVNRKIVLLQHTIVELLLLICVDINIISSKKYFYKILDLFSFKNWLLRIVNIYGKINSFFHR